MTRCMPMMMMMMISTSMCLLGRADQDYTREVTAYGVVLLDLQGVSGSQIL